MRAELNSIRRSALFIGSQQPLAEAGFDGLGGEGMVDGFDVATEEVACGPVKMCDELRVFVVEVGV